MRLNDQMKNAVPFLLLLAFCILVGYGGGRVTAVQSNDVDVNTSVKSQAQVRSSIEKTCRLAKDNHLCVTSLENDPNIVDGDPKGLAFGSIEVASSTIVEISNHVKVLVNNMSFSPQVQQGLVDCRDQFIDVADDLDDCLEAFVEHEFDDVQNWLKAAIDAAETCEDSLKGVETILLEKTIYFKGLCENALAINAAYASHNSTLV